VLLNYTGSILLIEDAEMVVLSREGENGNNQAVSNLLNMTDGILSDVLQMQVVCTFNTDISKIDQALLRPGRLIGKYEFNNLSADKTKKMVDTLYGKSYYKNNIKPGTEMSLAEIYAIKTLKFNDEKVKRKIGFT
jgi:ATP-dependent 26S proteasome regulatory subunit